MGRSGEAVERLEEIMRTLRAEGGCPWDRAQDIRTLRPYLVEETYEVLDEMDRVGEGGPWRALCEELGDLLFQIVFHAQLAGELGEFGLADVATAISDKIVSRHPHVFEGKTVGGAEEVLQNWARIKAEERRRKHGREGSVLDGVPSAAPALLRAERLTEKASRIGFDWPDLAGVRSKLSEELDELDVALASKEARAIEHELGDVLFSLANLARFTATPAEDALRAANARFTRRFHAVEEGLRARGVPFGTATLAQMDALWQQAKAAEAGVPPPASAPRAAVARLELGAPEPARAHAFWSSVGPALGWTVEVDGGEWSVETPGLCLCYAAGAASAATLTVDAPGLAADAHTRVRQAGGTVLSERPLVFRDPVGTCIHVR
ncbi:MAG TPA: nucleoside triphosphate pyrophosphohydrolase [Myxococcaceae bacterium]|nr:nucleoside triphosphate pyrophosphohydrolase [Myxococcaceae bacterium]